MDFAVKTPLKITDTILRDAHQSQAATRMTIEDMLPACKVLDSVGYWSLECWGGATFDACMRFLGEDPWERLRKLRKALPNTRLQMLFRGQNILGYKHYADDVVDAFCKKSIENGIDVVRIFDALNDTRNLKQAIDSVKKYKGWVEAALSYTTSPVHSEEYFVNLAKELERMGADSICIKDMANLLLPMDAYSLVSKLKKAVKVPIHLHTHNTTGTGDLVNLMAAYAGVDIVDTALSPLANGTSQPATESLVATLKGTPRDTGLDLGKLSEAAAHFRKVATRLKEAGSLDPKVLNVDTNTLLYQVPGGMLSNLLGQLKQAGKEDKYYDVLAEIPVVRKDFGYPPLVTPTSQIVGTQAVMNVVTGRYKMFPKESKGLLRGEYGALPGEVNEEVRKMAIGDEKVITCRPADLLEPELEKYKAEAGSLAKSEEDVLSYALFPQVAKKFLAERNDPSLKKAAPAPAPKKENKTEESDMKMYKVNVNGTVYEVAVEEIDGVPAAPAAAPVAAPVAAPASAAPAGGEKVSAPMPGTILSVSVQNGAQVKKGQVLMVLEAMKMENEIMAPCDGTITSVNINAGASVETGTLLCTIG